MTRLVDVGLVDSNWNSNQYSAMVTDSVVVFVVRKGELAGNQDLGRHRRAGCRGHNAESVYVGGARWNLMAAYGAQIESKTSSKRSTSSTSC